MINNHQEQKAMFVCCSSNYLSRAWCAGQYTDELSVSGYNIMATILVALYPGSFSLRKEPGYEATSTVAIETSLDTRLLELLLWNEPGYEATVLEYL